MTRDIPNLHSIPDHLTPAECLARSTRLRMAAAAYSMRKLDSLNRMTLETYQRQAAGFMLAYRRKSEGTAP